MVRESYRQELGRLLDSVPQMGQEVVKGIKNGLRAIETHDVALAKSMDAWDDTIDQQTMKIEKECTDLLALQQPVASDLRMILSVFKIATDLERVGDLAVNLGEYAIVSDAFVLASKEELLRLGRLACKMIEEALEAFREQNIEKAKAVIFKDRELDQACWDLRTLVLTELIKMAGKSNPFDQAEKIASNTITILWSIRDLERIGDHAGNISARMIYWLTANPEYI
jgi:phosphate transport system protein